MKLSFKVAARRSPLSKAQVKEILALMNEFGLDAEFDVTYVESTGDKDKKTSLRTLDKTDFFTKEIDELVLKGVCDFGLHSAKDLPEPLTSGLHLACLTKGIDPKDSLVLKEGMTLEQLPPNAVIATSCVRREECCRALRGDLQFIDLRGTIEERLKVLDRIADGVVIAEAALIRLNLTHLNRIPLPGPTAKWQGQLALVSKEGDAAIETFFKPLDCR